jgi:hypothetical protein
MLSVIIRRDGSTEVSGKTYQYRQLFKDKGFKWDPRLRIWTHKDCKVVNTLGVRCSIYDMSAHFVTKDTCDKRKIAILKACDTLPTDVTKQIFKMVRPPSCQCNDNIVCFNCKYACCRLAVPTFCVCTHATQCPTHGRRCNGSHD